LQRKYDLRPHVPVSDAASVAWQFWSDEDAEDTDADWDDPLSGTDHDESEMARSELDEMKLDDGKNDQDIESYRVSVDLGFDPYYNKMTKISKKPRKALGLKVSDTTITAVNFTFSSEVVAQMSKETASLLHNYLALQASSLQPDSRAREQLGILLLLKAIVQNGPDFESFLNRVFREQMKLWSDLVKQFRPSKCGAAFLAAVYLKFDESWCRHFWVLIGLPYSREVVGLAWYHCSSITMEVFLRVLSQFVKSCSPVRDPVPDAAAQDPPSAVLGFV